MVISPVLRGVGLDDLPLGIGDLHDDNRFVVGIVGIRFNGQVAGEDGNVFHGFHGIADGNR